MKKKKKKIPDLKKHYVQKKVLKVIQIQKRQINR